MLLKAEGATSQCEEARNSVGYHIKRNIGNAQGNARIAYVVLSVMHTETKGI